MNITVTIQAPELAKAIEALAAAISSKGSIATAGSISTQVPEEVVGQLQPFPETVSQPSIQPIAATQTIPVTSYQAPPVQAVQPLQSMPPVQQMPAAAPQPQVVPTAAPTYTMEQLAVAATQIVDAGRRNELVQLLASFGVQALTGLPKEQYGAFATKLREMGAKI